MKTHQTKEKKYGDLWLIRSRHLSCKIILISVFVTSCLHITPFSDIVRITKGVDQESKYYVKNFEKEFGVKLSNINIKVVQYSDDNTKSVGECHSYYIPKYRFILLRADYWKAVYMNRQQIVYHELLHCACDIQHDNSMVNIDGTYVPKSIMNEYIIPSDIYEHFRDMYIQDIKDKIKGADCDSSYIRMEEKR